jgi:hypothetical protein
MRDHGIVNPHLPQAEGLDAGPPCAPSDSRPARMAGPNAATVGATGSARKSGRAHRGAGSLNSVGRADHKAERDSCPVRDGLSSLGTTRVYLACCSVLSRSSVPPCPRQPRSRFTWQSSTNAAIVVAILAHARVAQAERPLAPIPSCTFAATILAAERCGYGHYFRCGRRKLDVRLPAADPAPCAWKGRRHPGRCPLRHPHGHARP